MKNLTFFIALLFSCILTAQDFPGNSPKVLLGREVKVKDNSDFKNYGYYGFFIDKELTKKYACCQKANSKYGELVNKTFKVEKVEAIDDKAYCLTLKGDSQTIYYKYSSTNLSKYPFEVIGGLRADADAPIMDMITETDNSKEVGGTSFITEGMNGIVFTKSNYNGEEGYFVTISSDQASLQENAKGVNLELENAIIIKRPDAKIKISPNANGTYLYNSTIILNGGEVAMLKLNKITGAILAGFKTEVKEGETLKGVFRRLTQLSPKRGTATAPKTEPVAKKSICDLIAAVYGDNGDIYIATNDKKNLMICKTTNTKYKSEEYEVLITIKTTEPTQNLKAAALLFDNGKEIKRTDAKMEIKALDNGIYKYTASFYLTPDEINLLKNNVVEEITVFTYKERLEPEGSLKEILNCPVMQGPKEGYRVYWENNVTKRVDCPYIKQTEKIEGVDDDSITLYTEKIDGINLYKLFSPLENITLYMASLQVDVDTIDKEAVGATIYLENGKRIARPIEKIKTDGYSKQKAYSVGIELTEAEMTLLKEYAITSIVLGAKNRKVNTGTYIKEMINCLIKK